MRRQPVQDFEAPPNKIGADRDGDRDFDQLDNEFIPRHRRPLPICADTRFVSETLERVKGIEPSSSAWKTPALQAIPTLILTNRPYLAPLDPKG